MYYSKFISLKNVFKKIFCCLSLSALFSANLLAECIGSTSIFCDTTVDAGTYHNDTINIPSAVYLVVEPSGGFNGIVNLDNGTWTFDNVNISTHGDGADALSALTNATINLHGILYASTNGSDTTAILADDNSNIILNDNVFINSNGANAISAKNGSYMNFNRNVFLESFANYSNGFYAQNATINVKGSFIVTVSGNNSNAFLAVEGALINLSENSTVNVKGYDSNAFVASNDSSIYIGSNLHISTDTNTSYAIFADNHSNIFLDNNSVINTNSHAIFANKNSSIILNGETTINTSEENSYALTADEDSNISTGNFVKLNIHGDILSNHNSAIELNMNNGSSFTGNTYEKNGGKINLSIDGSDSLWQIKGNSILTNLRITNGAGVDLTSNASYDLNIANLHGDNGVFYLKVYVDNDSLSGNKITINNASAGNHRIVINDSLSGNITNINQQLLLIEQSSGILSDYNANFTLNSGSVDIGQYVYTLNASSDANNKNFYLLTDGKLNNAALSSIGFLNINYFTSYLTIQTLSQRMGEIRNQQDIQNDIWIRVNNGKSDSFDEKLNISDINYYGITAGVDNVYGDILIGIFVDLLKADIDYLKGSGKGDSKAAGAYVTYKNVDGFYVDFISKYSSNNNEFDTITSGGFEVSGKGESKGFSATFESAKRIYADSFYIEPQIALTYSHQGDFVMKDLKFGSFDSIAGRASILAGYQLRNTNIYLKSGYIKEFDGKTSYTYKDDTQKYDYNIDGNFWENSVGIAMDLKNRHLYLEGTYQKGTIFNNQKINLGYRFVF
ncbi:MAG: autotransporter outer membrane beta-barrel domain-containing protein [Campylobacteraceae bacterium]|jgi:outer membrane autotransporter protein|nr:autotransporter outer membrane beta-barrel domain-containing protein [Campylobacteraceae bacterium]